MFVIGDLGEGGIAGVVGGVAHSDAEADTGEELSVVVAIAYGHSVGQRAAEVIAGDFGGDDFGRLGVGDIEDAAF